METIYQEWNMWAFVFLHFVFYWYGWPSRAVHIAFCSFNSASKLNKYEMRVGLMYHIYRRFACHRMRSHHNVLASWTLSFPVSSVDTVNVYTHLLPAATRNFVVPSEVFMFFFFVYSLIPVVPPPSHRLQMPLCLVMYISRQWYL